jgi:predicted alpha/beta-hydrolase family hydrolase
VPAPAAVIEPFEVAEPGPAVAGFVHRPARPSGDGLVLTHGAGGSCHDPLLVALADAFAVDGLTVLRCDLPYRQARRTGPPTPAGAACDRAGLRRALDALRPLAPRRCFLGGKSYGGRQASLLAADDPGLAAALLLLSYPLHPPARPRQLRTEHFPLLRAPVLFVHGRQDPFGSLDELEAARALIPVKTDLLVVEGGHDLGYAGSAGGGAEVPARVAAAFRLLV